MNVERYFNRETFYDNINLTIGLTNGERMELGQLLCEDFQSVRDRYAEIPPGLSKSKVTSALEKIFDSSTAFWGWADGAKRVVQNMIKSDEVFS